MRNSFLYLLVCCIFYTSCSNQPPKTIHFYPLHGTMFNFMADSTFTPPDGKVAAARKRAFDSCMGESYEPNAIFFKTKDTFQIGCIVNTSSMKVVKNIPFLSLPKNLMVSSLIRFIERPCYDKIKLNVSPSSFMNRRIDFSIPGVDTTSNKEFNALFNDSKNAQLEVSYWINVEFTDGLGKILDTTTNAELLDYKKYLADSSNMVLIRSTGVTIISFYISTDKPLTTQLQKALADKPLASPANSDVKIYLSLVNSQMFKVEFNGAFQIIGQFMKAKPE